MVAALLCIFLLLVETFSDWTCDLPNSAKDGFLLGLDILNEIPTVTFDEALQFSINNIGLDFLQLHLEWTSIETGVMTYQDPWGALNAFNIICDLNNIQFSLTLRPIDLSGKTVPSDLVTTRFNSPTMVSRFESLIDYVFGVLDPSLLISLQVGNEIDGYNTASHSEPPTFWSDYLEFLIVIREYVNLNYGVKVGFTAMYEGLVSTVSRFGPMASYVDVLGVTYYPHEGTQLKDPSLIRGDFDLLVSLYEANATEIFIQEAGYETSPLSGGTELKQAQFVCEMTHVMLDHPSKISGMMFLRLNDISLDDATATAIDYGMESSQEFIEYLRTLGLREYGGRDKDALGVLQDFDVVLPDSSSSSARFVVLSSFAIFILAF